MTASSTRCASRTRRTRRPADYFTKTIGEIDLARQGTSGARQTEVETDYFKVRIFKNGNAHLWFTRKDLVAKVNKLIGEYYGEVLADGRTAEDDPLSKDKANTSPARYFGFYPPLQPRRSASCATPRSGTGPKRASA